MWRMGEPPATRLVAVVSTKEAADHDDCAEIGAEARPEEIPTAAGVIETSDVAKPRPHVSRTG